jgi:hypothetical protein
MNSRLTWEAVEAMIAERHHQADSMRSAANAGARPEPPSRQAAPDAAAVTVRFATPEDARDIERLAQLDSGSVPTGPALVAEIEGELVAMLPLDRGRALADPFRPSAELTRLLELQRAQLRGEDGRRRRRFMVRRPGERRTVPAQIRP